MQFDHAEEQRKINARNLGLLISIPAGIGTAFGIWKLIWSLGFGPWSLSEKNGEFDATHGTINYLIHFVDGNFSGDLGATWSVFSENLARVHDLDSFLFTIWIPSAIGLIVFLMSWWWFYQILGGADDSRNGYIRGSRIKK